MAPMSSKWIEHLVDNYAPRREADRGWLGCCRTLENIRRRLNGLKYMKHETPDGAILEHGANCGRRPTSADQTSLMDTACSPPDRSCQGRVYIIPRWPAWRSSTPRGRSGRPPRRSSDPDSHSCPRRSAILDSTGQAGANPRDTRRCEFSAVASERRERGCVHAGAEHAYEMQMLFRYGVLREDIQGATLGPRSLAGKDLGSGRSGKAGTFL